MNVTIPDGWTATELTLSANQLWADWAKKQFKWQEMLDTIIKPVIQEEFLHSKASGISKKYKKSKRNKKKNKKTKKK